MATVLVARIVAVRCLLVVVAVVVVGLVSTAVMVMDVVDGQLRGLLMLNCAVHGERHKNEGNGSHSVGLEGPAHDGLGASEVEEDSLDRVFVGACGGLLTDDITDNATGWVLVMAFTSIFVKLSHIVDLVAHLGYIIGWFEVRPDLESVLDGRGDWPREAGLDSLAGNLRKLNKLSGAFPTDSIERLVLGEGLVCFLGRRVLLVWGVPFRSVSAGVGVHVLPWVVTDIVIGIVRGGVAFQRVVMRGSLDGNHSEGNGNDRIHLLVWYVILNFSN